jgi:hypothetical protein
MSSACTESSDVCSINGAKAAWEIAEQVGMVTEGHPSEPRLPRTRRAVKKPDIGPPSSDGEAPVILPQRARRSARLTQADDSSTPNPVPQPADDEMYAACFHETFIADRF